MTYKPRWEQGNQATYHRAEVERLAAERLLEEAKGLIEDAKLRVDKVILLVGNPQNSRIMYIYHLAHFQNLAFLSTRT